MTETRRVPGPWDDLTPVERRVIVLVAAGYSYDEAAARIGVQQATVRMHLYRARRATGYPSIRVMLLAAARDDLSD